MSQYFETEPNNISWLKSSGQYNSKTIYPAYYDWLLKIYNGVEVVDGVSVKLSTEEYTDYDFVLNTAEETFRLPLLDGSEDLPSDRFEELTATSENLTAKANGIVVLRGSIKTANDKIGLQNHTTQVDDVQRPSTTGSTVGLYLPVIKGDVFSIEATNYDITRITVTHFRFIYAQGNGSLYFYVGETVQNANLINAGRIEEIKANRSELDGQWEITSFGLITSTTSIKPDQTLTFDISDYLPKDNNIYEVILSGSIIATATSGNHLNLLYRTDIMPVNTNLCRVNTRTANQMYASGSCTVLVGAGRTIEIFASGGSVGTNSIDSLGLRAYRKVR
jgi:hypothetical protein